MIASYDVTSLFTCIPTQEAVKIVKECLLQESAWSSSSNFTLDHICALPDLCLVTTYFKYSEGFYSLKHGSAMGSPVSPIVANLYTEEVERKALITFTGTAPSHWFRYVDNTWVKIRTWEMEAFTESNIKFTWKDVREDSLLFLNCVVHTEEDRSLNIRVYRKPTHTDWYLLFNSRSHWNTSWRKIIPLRTAMNILGREDRWFEKGAKTSLNRRSGLQHNL